jgi:putative holliday junction resolvase
MSRVIGIDYGAKRVGIAVSDDSTSFAFPHAVLPNNDQLLDAIADIANKQVADTVVIGESDNPAGGENTITRRITIFGEALKIRTGLPVTYVSEAYSTKEARRVYETVEKNRKSKTPVVDDAAATIILQTYLDTRASRTATSQ